MIISRKGAKVRDSYFLNGITRKAIPEEIELTKKSILMFNELRQYNNC